MRKIKFRAWAKGGMWGDEAAKRWLHVNKKEPIIMQFTGLKDKNGKEIYEGDVVKDIDGNNWECKFTGQRLLYNKDGADWSDIFENMEIIGNIYESPELKLLHDVNVANSEQEGKQ